MSKLFHGKTYVIGEIKKKEIKELLEIAKEHNLKILYPEVFEDAKESLYRIAIDDKYLGGFVSTIICWQELTRKKNPKWGYFNDVKELKNYIKTQLKQDKPFFLLEKSTTSYSIYIDALEDNELIDEYHQVRNIIDYLDTYHLAIKEQIEKELNKQIKEDINKPSITIDDVNKYITSIFNLINEIDDIIQNKIYTITKDDYFGDKDGPISKPNTAMMKSYLKRKHQYFLYGEDNSYFHLNNIRNNLTIIYDIFNYKINKKGHINKTIKTLGYDKDVPNYLIGNKINNKWNYQSVLSRFLYTLKIYDCYPLLTNKFIPLSYKSLDEIETLTKLLKFKDINHLSHVTKQNKRPISIILEIDKKIIRIGPGITAMAHICNSRRRKPLPIQTLLDNFDKVITNYDFVVYNNLLKRLSVIQGKCIS